MQYARQSIRPKRCVWRRLSKAEHVDGTCKWAAPHTYQCNFPSHPRLTAMSPNWCSFCADSCKGRTTKRQRADHLRLAPTLKGQNMRQSLLPEAPQRNAVYIPHAILHASHHEAPSVLVRVQVQRQPVKTRHQVCSQKQCDKAQSSRATSPKTTPQPPGLEQIGKRFVALENSHAAVAVARVAQRLQALIVRVCLQAGIRHVQALLHHASRAVPCILHSSDSPPHCQPRRLREASHSCLVAACPQGSHDNQRQTARQPCARDCYASPKPQGSVASLR